MIRGDTIVQEVVLPVTPEELFAWFSEPTRIATWMGTAAHAEIRPGGVYSCLLPGGQAWDGLVVELSPPHRLVVTFGWRDPAVGMPAGTGLVEWEFARHSSGTRLRMTLLHVPPPLLELLNDSWARLYARLRNVLAGRAPGPHPLEDAASKLGATADPGR